MLNIINNGTCLHLLCNKLPDVCIDGLFGNYFILDLQHIDDDNSKGMFGTQFQVVHLFF